jgi:hypothetical protein
MQDKRPEPLLWDGLGWRAMRTAMENHRSEHS